MRLSCINAVTFFFKLIYGNTDQLDTLSYQRIKIIFTMLKLILVGTKGVSRDDIRTCIKVSGVDTCKHLRMRDIPGLRNLSALHAFSLKKSAHGTVREKKFFAY